MGQKIASMEIELLMATGQAISDLIRFGGVVDSTTADALKHLDRIDNAMKHVGGMGAATASANEAAEALGRAGAAAKLTAAEQRDLNRATKERERAEASGEALLSRLRRENELYGLTKAEVKALRIEEAARRVEASNAQSAVQNTALPRELREQAAAIEANAQATRDAAFAHQLFEARVREGVAAMKAEEAAAEQDARALQRIREMLDPAAAAQDRLNAEMAEAQRVMKAAGLSGEEIARVHAVMTKGAGGVVTSTGNMRAGMQQLSYQLNDAATMWSLQAPPMQIFASQAGQVTQAIQLMAGESKGFIGFLGGPWGLALTTAAVVLVPLIGSMVKFGNAIDDAVDKLKKEAAEAEQSRIAHERFEQSAEGVAAAIRDQARALDEAAKAEHSAAILTAASAKVELDRLIGIRKTTAALLEQAIAREELNRSITQYSYDPLATALVTKDGVERVVRLQQMLAEQQKALTLAQDNFQRGLAGVMVEAGQRATDSIGRINRMYDQQVSAARRAAEASGMVSSALAAETAAINRRREAALKAEQERTAAANATVNQAGRNIDLAEARGIAASVGGRVTSDHRTFEEQKRLYDKYMAYKAGGPWAAIAAKPGTSNHELDHAIDVAKSGGVTLAKLVTAFRAAGVKLVEQIDEGSHYHIAWKSVGSVAKQETAAMREAAKATKDYNDMLAGFADRARERTGAYHVEVQKLIEDWGKLVNEMGQPVNVDQSLKGDLKIIGDWVDGQTKERAQAEQEHLRDLAYTFEGLFQRGVGSIWDDFERRGARILSELAAEWANDLTKGGKDALGSLARSASVGVAAGSLLEGFGVKGSDLGGAAGGIAGNALGTAIGGPLGGKIGSIIGGALGSFAGGLLKTTKKGVATLGLVDGQLDILSVTGNSGKRMAKAVGVAGSLLDTLGQLADQLGGGIGTAGSVSIGIRKGDYRVDPTGAGRTKAKGGVIDFNDDEQAAIEFALRDLIADGAIIGLREATSRLLNGGGDLQKQVQKALDFEGVFTSLQQELDPTAFAVAQLDKQFAGLRRTFAEAAASADEVAQLEQLYALRRAAIDRQAEEKLNAERQLRADLLEAQGDAAGALALSRQITLSTTDDGLRSLQQQVWAAQDAKEAADAAKQLSEAWKGVGGSIMDEVKRIRGLNDATGGGSFASLMGQFNAANSAARGGDMDAARGLPQLSKSLLDAAALAATSRQELDRVQGQTAAALEATYAAIETFGTTPTADPVEAAATATAAQATATASNTADLVMEVRALREEVAQLRAENRQGHAATAGNTGRSAKVLENVTAASGGDAVNIANVA